MRTIAAQWESFRAAVYPPGTSDVQLQECRRAFYAGAQGMQSILHELAAPEVSEDAGVAVLEGLKQEASGFAVEVLAGRA